MPRIHFPYHNYLGPGSDNFKKQPVDEDDAIARAHDLDYDKASSDKDIFKADKQARDEFFSSFVHSGNLHSLIGGLGLGAKNLVEEHVLGKSLYGMGKRKSTEKDWAKIKRINTARAARRNNEENQRDIRNFGHVGGENINPDAEVNLADFPDFLQDFVAEAGPSGSQPTETAQESPPGMSQDEVPMDTVGATDVGGGAQVDPRSGGQAAGGMGAGGAANDGRQDIYAGAPQPNQHHEFVYGKSYHFTLTNGLPDFRHFINTISNNYSAQLRFKHIHGIPWERLLMYLSEGEYLRLMRDYTAVKVEEVVCEVYSLGVRLPFVTSATTSSVANANAQYPIGCFHFDKAYETQYDVNNINDINDIINKALGSEWKNTTRPAQPVTTSWSETFPNITASATSRDINNPVIVQYPLPYGINNAPKDVGIYDYVDIKNGTTAYGKCWEKRFKPKNGILYAESSLLTNGNTTAVEGPTNFMTPIPGLENGYFIGTNQISERSDSQIRIPPKAYTATKYNTSDASRLESTVDYNGFNFFGEQKCAPQAMPKFMIGFVNIRNEDNSLLTAKWDIMIKTRIHLSGLQSTREWISRTDTIPPQWFTSQYTQFRYEDIFGVPLVRANGMQTNPTHRPGMISNYNPNRSNTENVADQDETIINSQKKLRHKSALLPLLEKPVTRSKKLLKQ
ncbi:viral protein 1-4 [Casphalia extranea densovirus]|uniref:Viral protein 1-4 n=1 Tax=Casphalia extranea densovirus TaxID=180586 RepID=Q8V5A7_9VIRU|nr:viral protein 1-4 [Casphalia extranea densovirus]AAL56546.1 viral protein 1-4 [Casphalia extranea densovirus]